MSVCIERLDDNIFQHQRVTTHLHDLSPTTTQTDTQPAGRTPSQATQVGTQLQADRTAFGETLQPYFASLKTHVDRVKQDPLFHAITQASDGESTCLLVIATDDSHQQELREAVKLAVQRGNQVLVFLTPRALFDNYALADLEATYDQYLAFEEFRRELDRAPRTRAFEVGPGDRIDAVLNAATVRRGQEASHE
jgi:hypothetical protein